MLGDEVGFGDWVAARRPALLRTAFLLTGDRFAADDLVQAALERVALRWDRIVATGPPEPYVRQVLYREHVSVWRRHRRVALAVDVERVEADRSHEVDVRVVLQRALGRLTRKQRAVLVLRYCEDLSESQTATMLGVAVGTVKSQTRDALRRLRETAPELRDLLGTVSSEDQEVRP